MSVLLQPLALAFRMGLALRATSYQHGWVKSRKLGRPVISVGNLTVGGTGKTPLVICIAEALLKLGRKPGILSRGYGRRGRAALVAIEPGSSRNPDPHETGDEPALLARALPEVPIIVGADRFRGGRLAEDRFGVDVHLLDDGFQYWSLARELDVVALDATRKLSDRALLPAGRQREPCSALRRAQIVVITRTELAGATEIEGLEERVRSINPWADIIRARTKLCGWRSLRTGVFETNGTFETFACNDRKPLVAFCGVGNPEAFFANLRQWGCRVEAQKAYRDHHRYVAADLTLLQRLARQTGASALVTTEKDAMNLPAEVFEIAAFACVMRIEVIQPKAFAQAILERISAYQPRC